MSTSSFSSSSYSSRSSSLSSEPPTLKVSNLTGNVHEGHLLEIFADYGKVNKAEVAVKQCKDGKLKRGFGYVEFEYWDAAEDALECMNGGQIDGNRVTVAFHSFRKRTPPRRLSNYPRRSRSRSYSPRRRPQPCKNTYRSRSPRSRRSSSWRSSSRSPRR